jgi:hypothetical protein
MLEMDKLVDTTQHWQHGPKDCITVRSMSRVKDDDSDPDDIDNDPQEWKDLIANVTISMLGGTVSQAHLNMGLRLLKSTLILLFTVPSIIKLVEEFTGVQERISFSLAATKAAQDMKWSKTTAQKAFRIMCRILSCTTMDQSFTNTIKLIPAKNERNVILGNKYSKRPSNDPTRVLLESWVLSLKENTNCKSDLSLKNIVNFILSACLPAFGLHVESWPDNAKESVHAQFDEAAVIKICQGKQNGRKACWLQVFLTHIVKTTCMVDKGMRKRLVVSTAGHDDDIDDDGSDHHRISSGDLDKMFLACTDQGPHKLIFMLMITTGLRVGGLANIRIARVAKLEGNRWGVQDSGRTICKGNKIYRFAIGPQVKDLIEMWLYNHRPSDPTPFLFPGRDGGKISTSTVRQYFNAICLKAGLKGEQFHPHALRHSFAHILLESGNTSSIVANLMNHASSTTTEKFYLRESAEQITARAIIPWMKNTDKKRTREPIVPTFLEESDHSKEQQKRQERKKKRKKTKLGSLAMFKPLPLENM